MKRSIDYVNVFQGNGKIDLPKPEGIAATWLFLKAQVGNTHPLASYPFGKMSAGAYTGGYPTGYGNLRPSSHGECPTFDAKVRGFAHIHQTGTGSIGYYYNYALVSPGYGDPSHMEDELSEETAEPGYYRAILKNSGIEAEMTVSSAVALHRYKIPGGGRLQIDMANNGCHPDFGSRFSSVISMADIRITSATTATARIVTKKGGVPLYFAFKCPSATGVSLWKNYKSIDECVLNEITEEDRYGISFECGENVELYVSYSFISREAAEGFIDNHTLTFDDTRATTKSVWESYLSAIEIDADEETKEIFYSNFYHSLLKPSYTMGERFVGECEYFDFSTLWDMYKTALPLIFTLYSKEAEGIARTFISAIKHYGRSPIKMAISYNGEAASQARMLMEHSLADYYYRYGKFAKEIIDSTEKDLECHTDFLDTGLCDRYSHFLDITEALAAVARIADENGDERSERFAALAATWPRVYDKNDGLLYNESVYYEGNRYNYSFRQMHDMDARVRITGNVDDFIDKLDELFGYTREAIEQHRDHSVDPATLGINSFEGFNNESDMEAPYSYIWVGQHYKTAEIIRAGLKYMFTRGKGGIPGNNDSGALSSHFVWGTIGLYPVAGQDLVLIGSPTVRNARLKLGNGKTIEIRVLGDPDTMVYVESVSFNDREIVDYRISVREMMRGGVLEIKLSDKRNA